MDYREARTYLDSINKYGSVLGLESIKNLLDKLGNPQEKLKFVHIAGTNGKGSVLAFVSSILTCAGYRTGRYVSPSVFSYREKIQVNGAYIDKGSLTKLTEEIKRACQELEIEGKPHPTIFEVETALAFLYFVQENCDIVVLETGLGGLLDATNVIKNTLVAVLTSISMDHMGILGNSLEEIAEQKAGIIKPGCRVVTAKQTEEVLAVMKRKVKEKQCGLTIADPDRLSNIQYGLTRQRFTYETQDGSIYEDCEISQSGTYQIENAMLAIEVAEALKTSGFDVEEKNIRQGLVSMKWLGRFTVIKTEPLVILDGAHNRDGAKRLAQSVQTYLNDRKIIGIMGVFADKEYDAIASITAPLADRIIAIQTPDNERALAAKLLTETIRKYNPNAFCAETIGEAVDMAWQEADKDTAIIAFGSLSHLAELYRAFEEKK